MSIGSLRALQAIAQCALIILLCWQSGNLGAGTNHEVERQELHDRLKGLVARGLDINSYSVAKALAWIRVARHFDARGDKSGFVQEAQREARRLVATMEQIPSGQPDLMETPVLRHAKRIRDDVWQQAAKFKSDLNFHCAAERVARMEVEIVAAGHADQDFGWRFARRYVVAAERFGRDATDRLADCAPKRERSGARDGGPSTAKPTQAETSTARTTESTPARDLSITLEDKQPLVVPILPNRVHFARESAEVSQASALVLEQVSYVMRSVPRLQLELTGFATEGAADEDNLKLAQARVESVRDYLAETGVGAERLAMRVRNAVERVGEMKGPRARRVEIKVTGGGNVIMERQDGDLAEE